MTKEEAYLLWRTGELPAPPKEHEAYCKAQVRKPRLTVVK